MASSLKVNLFFGCRTEKDFIYEDAIRRYERDGMVNLHLGLSGAPGIAKKYVQHSIADMGDAAAHLPRADHADPPYCRHRIRIIHVQSPI